LVALYSQCSQEIQSEFLEKLQINQQKMKYWANFCPENFLHRFLLVESEICRLKHDFVTAIDLYDRAIAAARDNGYLHEEALANELAAKFYLSWQKPKFATSYMQSAYYCYARWGAKAKTDQLEKSYPDLLQPILQPVIQNWSPLETLATLTSSNISFSTSTKASYVINNSLNTSLDFAALLKASQTISSTIHLDQLLQQLTPIILQNSGGDICVLVLPNSDGNWYLQAIATPETSQLYSQTLDENINVPLKLIQYVKNSHEVVLIDRLKTNLPVIDKYFIKHTPQSVLCMPILHQGNLIGIVYLENRFTSAVFSQERILILNFLCTQAAISLENARLYDQVAKYSQNLEAEVEQKTHALNQKAQDLEQALQHLQKTQAQLIHTEKMSSLGQLVAGVAHEINNPISFIRGNLTYLDDYIAELINLLELYQEEFLKPSSKIQAKLEEIELDFICQDVTNILQSMKIGSDRISQIVLNLRNFSRLDEAPIKAVDLHSGIDSTLSILQNRLQATEDEREIKVIKQYSNLPTITCYAAQMNQVFLHILNNAIDAIREDNACIEQPEIRIRTELTECQQIRIIIANTSSFIPLDIQKRIFEPFFTTKPVGRGTGLGLFICYSIIKKHGGNITVNSIPQKETEFIISIPIKN
jgi:signal transduction histidine kinase